MMNEKNVRASNKEDSKTTFAKKRLDVMKL